MFEEDIKKIEKDIKIIEEDWKSPRDDFKWTKRSMTYFEKKARLDTLKQCQSGIERKRKALITRLSFFMNDSDFSEEDLISEINDMLGYSSKNENGN